MSDQAMDRPDEWVASGGGPLLVLPVDALPYWNGADEQESALIPSLKDGGDSDYARACSVQDWIGLISVGPSEGLILADEPLDTRWWRDPWGATYLLRWMYGDTPALVIQSLADLASAAFQRTGLVFRNASDRVVLFDSAMPGTDILTPYSSIGLPRGAYNLDLTHFEPSDTTKMIVVRITPAESGLGLVRSPISRIP
jgi:hypothetical protein